MGNVRIVYSSASPLLEPRQFLSAAWRDLLGSKETAIRLFRQYVAQRYRYSSLGLIWAFAPSAITALVLTVGRRGATSGESHAAIPAQFYAVFGLILAQTFIETFNTQRTVFSSHSHLLSRNRTPIEGILLSGVADNLFSLSIRIIILVALFAVFQIRPAATLPLGLVGFACVFLVGSGAGLLLAPLSVLKRDIDNVMTFFPFIVFGLTPVFVEARPGSGLNQVYRLNPLTWIFEATRSLTYGSQNGAVKCLAIFVIVSCIVLPIAWLLCRIARPYVVERFLT